MSVEPELPYFPLPTEHERPTRRWGTYRADVVVTVDGVDWGFRFLEGNTYFVQLPFVKGESKIFMSPGVAQSDGALARLVKSLHVGGEEKTNLCRIVVTSIREEQDKVVLMLRFDGQMKVLCANNGPFIESRDIIFFNEHISIAHGFSSDAIAEMDERELHTAVEKVDLLGDSEYSPRRCWFKDSRFVSWGMNQKPYEEYRFYNEEHEPLMGCTDFSKIVDFLISEGVVECVERVVSGYSMDYIVKCCLLTEDSIWAGVVEECELYADLRVQSQFEPPEFSLTTYCDSHKQPQSKSNRLSNLFDIVVDEFETKGACFWEAYDEDGFWMPYGSQIIHFLDAVSQPSQHERTEALVELKKWLLSVDVSEQDAELLLADKLPKGWLAQQPKIKW